MNTPDPLDTLLDNALNELPLAPLPDGLIQGVMAQIAPRPQIEPFRLNSADIWLALTLTCGVACAMWIGLMGDLSLAVWGIDELKTITTALTNDWTNLSIVIVMVELMLAAVIYLGYTVAPSWHDFDLFSSN